MKIHIEGGDGDSTPANSSANRMIWPFDDRPEPARVAAQSDSDEEMGILGALAAALPDPILLLDADGRVVISNPPAEAVLETNLRGMHISHAIRSPAILDAVNEARASGEAMRVDFTQRFPLERQFEAFIAPLLKRAAPSSPVSRSIVILLRDLTREQQLERMRADFVANASHEMRTPLASLLGFIDTLQGPAKEDASARERFLSLMRSQAERMARLIDDLLSLSRIELNANRRPAEVVDFSTVVRQAAELLTPSARQNGITMNLDLSGQLEVLGDRDELLQVMQNLIENAIKYASSGKRIDLAGRHDGKERIEISVKDYGPGIPAEHIPRLTERFYRVSIQESRSRGGTGLGLAIVKHILNRHRAKLMIASEIGKGSRFAIVIAPAKLGK